jgi:hypothetical protein
MSLIVGGGVLSAYNLDMIYVLSFSLFGPFGIPLLLTFTLVNV